MRFLLGLLFGVGLGAALGLLIAPQSGTETRQALQKRIRHAAEEAEQAVPVS